MTDTASHTVQLNIDYCDSKWREADQATGTDWPPPDMLAGKKMAYNCHGERSTPPPRDR